MSFDGAGSFNEKDNRGGHNPFAAAYIPDKHRQPEESRYSRPDPHRGESSKGLLGNQQTYVDIDQDRDHQDHMISNRAEEITVIKGQMRDVNDLFKSLATMIDGQSEMVDTISANISTAAQNTSHAVKEIKGAEEAQSGERSKLCWFAVIITILIIIIVAVVFVVLKVRDQI